MVFVSDFFNQGNENLFCDISAALHTSLQVESIIIQGTAQNFSILSESLFQFKRAIIHKKDTLKDKKMFKKEFRR